LRQIQHRLIPFVNISSPQQNFRVFKHSDSMTDVHLLPAHGWVLASIGAGYVIHSIWMSVKVGQARKKYGELR
jgi:hypothetical protein